MKYEPLKGKERVVQFVGNLRRKDGGIHKMLLINRGFLATDVKSAVQGLLEEIEKEIKEAELEKEGKGYYRFFDNVMTLKRVKSLVKKWLVDETEEER